MIHVLIALGVTALVIGAASAAVYGVGVLRHGRQGMEERKTRDVLRTYADDRANDPTRGWADF